MYLFFRNGYEKQAAIKRIVLFLIIISLIILLATTNLLFTIAQFFSDIFSKIGFSTRIFDLLIEGDIANSTGRDKIYGKVLDAIWQRPIFGHGLLGDRPIAGRYVHNIFLEIWCHFGVVGGSVILFFIFKIIVTALHRNRGHEIFPLLLLFTCLVFTKLMLSGSYTVEPFFFFLLGLSMNAIRRRRKEI